MHREALIAAMEDTWRQLDAAIDGLDAAAMAEHGVVETWSIADLLGHLTAWEQAALRCVERWRRGEPPAGLGDPAMDDYNAAELARRRDWSLAQVREESAETRRQLRATLQGLVDDDWAALVGEGSPEGTPRRPLGEWIGGALGGRLGPGTHAAEHAQHIRLWRDARERRRAAQITAFLEARRELLRAVDGLSDDALTRPADDGAWSVRDVLAHIAAWDGLLARSVEAWLDGAVPPEPVPDEATFNARAAERASHQPVAATLIALATAHEDILAAVQRANGRGGDFSYPWGGRGDLTRAADDQSGHEREHAAEILAWRGQLS